MTFYFPGRKVYKEAVKGGVLSVGKMWWCRALDFWKGNVGVKLLFSEVMYYERS